MNNLQKLKEKIESQPEYVVVQQKQLSHEVFVFDCNTDIQAVDVVNICKKYHTEEFQEKEKQAVYAWRSDYMCITSYKIPEFNTLFDVVTSKIEKIKHNASFGSYKNYTYIVDHYWFAIYNTGDGSKVHSHGYVDWACVYYASVPKNSAPLIIPSLSGDITIEPKAGILVIMPGYCDHMVPISNHEGERIIVAMNLVKVKNTKFLKE